MNFFPYTIDDSLDFSTKRAVFMLFFAFALVIGTVSNRFLFTFLIDTHSANLITTRTFYLSLLDQ